MKKKKCTQCGRSFIISESELRYFKNRGLEEPKRCQDCRNVNKGYVPQGNYLETPSSREKINLPGGERADKNFRIACIAIIAVAVVLFGGLTIKSFVHTKQDMPETVSTYHNPSILTETGTQPLPEITEESTTKKYTTTTTTSTATVIQSTSYSFASNAKLQQHYEKHGIDMGYTSAEEYERAAIKVIENKDSLHKTEKEDGDDVYYLEMSNEFVVVANGTTTIRTYFMPDAGKAYYDKQ